MWNQGQLGASELSAEISDLCSFSTNIFANRKISTFCSPKMPCSLVFTLTLQGRSTHWIPRILCQSENPLDPKRTKTAGWIWWERWPKLGATLLTLKSLKQMLQPFWKNESVLNSILLLFGYRWFGVWRGLQSFGEVWTQWYHSRNAGWSQGVDISWVSLLSWSNCI